MILAYSIVTGEEGRNMQTSLFPLNPFSDDYLAQEIAFYAMPKGVLTFGSVKAFYVEKSGGRLDDYLNQRVRDWLPPIPTFFIQGKVWMSLAPIEVQSTVVALGMARGRVGTAGLGMGYFALRAAAKAEVTEVVVYEENADVIAFFQAVFAQRPEYGKIRIVHGDVRGCMRGRIFDLVYMDPYQYLLPDEVVSDVLQFRAMNGIGHYRFWGMERVLLDALLADERPFLFPLEAAFFQDWAVMPLRMDAPDGGMLRDQYVPLTDVDFRTRVMQALRREEARSQRF